MAFLARARQSVIGVYAFTPFIIVCNKMSIRYNDLD